MGAICIIAGIAVILMKVIFFMFTEVQIPFDGRGQFLVGTGTTLLGITSFDGLINSKSNSSNNGKETNTSD